MSNLPVVCTLTPETIRTRKAGLLPGLVGRASAVEPLDEGLRLRFEPSGELLQAIASTIDAERQCCRFLQFDVSVAPDGGPVAVTLTGPRGTAEFLRGLIEG